MGIGLTYKDTVKLVIPALSSEGYATRVVESVETVNALFISSTGWSHNNNQNAIVSDAELYIDPNNQFVKNNFNRIEGMLVIANRFGSSDEESWYKITNVRIGEDKLLSNTIDNIRVSLKKTSEIPYVS